MTSKRLNQQIHKFLLFVFMTLQGCATPMSAPYKAFYSHLDAIKTKAQPLQKTEYFVVIFVDARHLDYTENYSFLKTIAKHPSDGSKNRDVGHAWIYLEGKIDEERICIEGGHSGERGLLQPKYFDGIMNYLDDGYLIPPISNTIVYRYEPNPIKYLWETQNDGFFQQGSGNHSPTYAVKIDLTPQQFKRIYSYVMSYQYHKYAITSSQCTSFAAHIASLGGVDLDCEVTMEIQPSLYFRGQNIRLWTDPCYSSLTIPSPDILEKSLIKAVAEGRAQRVF